MRASRHIGILLGLAAFGLLAGGVIVYVLGTPASGRSASVTVSALSAPAGASGAVPGEAGAGDPLAIEIPGCVCHSDDPELVARHATYRMSQCLECHAEGTPATGE